MQTHTSTVSEQLVGRGSAQQRKPRSQTESITDRRWRRTRPVLEQLPESVALEVVLLIRVWRPTQIAGVTVIADINGFSFKHIRNLGIDQIRSF